MLAFGHRLYYHGVANIGSSLRVINSGLLKYELLIVIRVNIEAYIVTHDIM